MIPLRILRGYWGPSWSFNEDQLGWRYDNLPRTGQASDTFLALLFSSVMAEAQIEYVCQGLPDSATRSRLARHSTIRLWFFEAVLRTSSSRQGGP